MAVKKVTEKNLSQKSFPNSSKRLYRSSSNKIIAGVCGGLGEYFSIDPTIIRILFILMTIFGGSGILIYLLFWIIMPPAGKKDQPIEESLDLTKQRSKNWLAILLIALGFVFLFNGIGYTFNGRDFWPLLLIMIGLFIIFRKK